MIINTRIRLALHHLKKGVIAHPTDTIYGLACLANNPSGIQKIIELKNREISKGCLLYTSPSPRDRTRSRMPSSA